ncbi:hypothetical protein C8F04DRAFT_69041 [Mycena alexandri]|uniref:Uncharacterized protein n=1 Tax=Mycena alexandri TaxID=1745969 RepID=A0AAD6SIG0_9AGAR|nr:hypothetical protein C8F04DRAFT_69041 [Mycena alexandri]
MLPSPRESFHPLLLRVPSIAPSCQAVTYAYAELVSSRRPRELLASSPPSPFFLPCHTALSCADSPKCSLAAPSTRCRRRREHVQRGEWDGSGRVALLLRSPSYPIVHRLFSIAAPLTNSYPSLAELPRRAERLTHDVPYHKKRDECYGYG